MRRFGELAAPAAIRDALPWSLAGLAAGILLFFLASFTPDAAAVPLGKRYAAAVLPGFGLMSVCLCAVLALKLAQRLRLNAVVFVPACFSAFLLCPPPGEVPGLRAYLTQMGAAGLFLAILICFAAAGAARLTRRTWLGGALVVAAALAAVMLHVSLSGELYAVLRPLGFLGDSYAALIVITVIETALWTAGVHGPAVLAAIVTPVYLYLQQQNTVAYDHHQALPHIVVVSIFLFVFPGGAGATLPLCVMLALSRAKKARRIGRFALLPSLFNINEPLLFGLPLVLNPFFAIPFVVAPAVLATITYAAMWFGYVGRPITYWPSSVPSIVATYLATLDWRAVVLIALNLAVAAAIYWPFFRAYERHEARA